MIYLILKNNIYPSVVVTNFLVNLHFQDSLDFDENSLGDMDFSTW